MLHYLNPVPIREIADRWISRFSRPMAGALVLARAGARPPEEERMSQVLAVRATLRCDARAAFESFTRQERLESWLCARAEVEPRVGGKYELFWDAADPAHDSTIGCRLTAIEPDRLVAFDWKGPRAFERFMNEADPLTHVAVLFTPAGKPAAGTTVRVLHTGWRRTPEWQEARRWFERNWTAAFERLAAEVASPAGPPTEGSGPPVRFVVVHAPGPLWKKGISFREQPGVGDHVRFMAGLAERDQLVMGGPFLDDSGGMAVLRVADAAEARRIAETDPAVRSGLLTFTVRPWLVPMGAK